MTGDSTKKPIVRCAIVKKTGNLQMHTGIELVGIVAASLQGPVSLHWQFDFTGAWVGVRPT